MRLLLLVFLLIPFWSQSQESVKRYSLEECIDIALENNLSVKLSKLDQKTSEINLLQSRLNRLPDLRFNTSYGINWGRSIDPTTNNFINQRINFSSLSGQSSLTLFGGMQLTNSIKRDELNYEVAQNNLSSTNNEVAISVTTFYLDVIFNKELLQNARAQMEVTERQLDQTIKLVEAGSLPISNQLEIEAQLASDEVNLINNENSLDLSLLQLKQALQVPSSQDFDIAIPEVAIDASTEILRSAEEIYGEALSLQPEIRSADLQVESSLVNMKVARGSLYPLLSLNAGLSTNFSTAANRERLIFDGSLTPQEVEIGFLADDPTQRVNAIRELPTVVDTDPDFTFTEQFDENLSKSLSLNLAIPVFNRWRTRNDIQLAKVNSEQAEINAEQVRNQLRQNIETAHNNAEAALKSYQASTRQVDALERTFENVENRFNLGVANFVDYQVARNNLVQATSDLTRAKYDYIFRLKILDFYQGKPLSFN